MQAPSLYRRYREKNEILSERHISQNARNLMSNLGCEDIQWPVGALLKLPSLSQLSFLVDSLSFSKTSS